jgi:hypothetical protein
MWLGGVDRKIEEGGYLGYHPTTHFVGPFPTFGEETKKFRDKDEEYFSLMGIPKNHRTAYDKGSVWATSKVYDSTYSLSKCSQHEVISVDKSTVLYRCFKYD